MTAPGASLILDNEAVQALSDAGHPKHRRALAFIEVANQRNRRGRTPIAVLVPVAVRVEAGWDRQAPAAAIVNRVSRARDVILDGAAANRAAQLSVLATVSVVDATIGQAAETAPQPAVILTSDLPDMARLSSLVAGEVRIIGV